jgi:ABC-type phosphate transport system substrate-binding protein
MLPAADGINRAFNSAGTWLNAHYWDVLGPVITAAVIGVVTVIWNRYFGRRRFGWNLVWDERINQDDPSAPRAPAHRANGDGPSSRQRMWEIIYRPAGEGNGVQVSGSPEAGPQATGAWEFRDLKTGGQAPGGQVAGWPESGGQPAEGQAPANQETGGQKTIGQEGRPYPVRDGSLVVMELRNTGRKPIVEADFGEQHNFTLKFPGRKVVHYKIRENDRYHDQVQRTAQPVVPGTGNSFELPALPMNPGDFFKLLVLLEGNIPRRTPARERVEVQGTIVGGKIVEFDNRPHRWRWAVPLVIAVAIAGLFVGLRLGTGSQALAPACASGQLTVAGSTAFAPIINQVATEYEQYCPGARITVSAVGSVQGLTDLQAQSGPVVAMYDGVPAQPLGPQYVSQPVGDIIYAVVGNRSLPSNVFEAGNLGGMTVSQIAQAFNDPSVGEFAPVGRSSASGTRQVFVQQLLGGNDGAEKHAGSCPEAGGVAGAVCLVGTTMELLADVNATPNAIGYTEADALPFFPHVGAIPINGYAPSRTNALDGNYTFLTTEHLYTVGVPAGLTADLIGFLKSAPVTAQLRATTSFIACADLAGSTLSTACQQ